MKRWHVFVPVSLSVLLLMQGAQAVGWRVKKETSPIDDSTNVILMTNSLVPTKANYPGCKNFVPTLIFRCKEGEAETYVGVCAPADVESEEGVSVIIRFDKEKAYETSMGRSTGDSSLFFADSDVEGFAIQFIQHDQLLFQYTPFRDVPQTFFFKLTGFEMAFRNFKEPCGSFYSSVTSRAYNERCQFFCRSLIKEPLAPKVIEEFMNSCTGTCEKQEAGKRVMAYLAKEGSMLLARINAMSMGPTREIFEAKAAEEAEEEAKARTRVLELEEEARERKEEARDQVERLKRKRCVDSCDRGAPLLSQPECHTKCCSSCEARGETMCWDRCSEHCKKGAEVQRTKNADCKNSCVQSPKLKKPN